MPEYKKVGYLTTSFKMFHLKDTSRRGFTTTITIFSQDPDIFLGG